MKQIIPFRSWSGKASLEIEIPDDTDACFRLRAAVEIAVGSGADLRDAGFLADDQRRLRASDGG